MSLKKSLHRGLKFIIQGTPVKNITADISYLQPNKRLFGKKIIITGGGRGLGASMAAKFVAEGARKIILSKKQNEFANQMVPNFLKEAQALGITKDELVKIIEGGFQ